MNILLADDHQIVRDGLRRILSESPDFSHIEEAGSATEVLDLIRTTRLDAVVLDINLPGRSGLDVLKDIRRDYPAVPVLVLSMYPEEQFAVRVMRAGAAGYINKASAGKVLVDALRQVCNGHKFITPQVAHAMASALEAKEGTAPRHTQLSDRELEVFHKIARGKTVGEVAEELNLSVKTISTYRTHILEKMGLRNNAEIMRYAVEHTLLD
jgi:two-component system, NarL family, invasion response regulator UvrY